MKTVYWRKFAKTPVPSLMTVSVERLFITRLFFGLNIKQVIVLLVQLISSIGQPKSPRFLFWCGLLSNCFAFKQQADNVDWNESQHRDIWRLSNCHSSSSDHCLATFKRTNAFCTKESLAENRKPNSLNTERLHWSFWPCWIRTNNFH